MYDSCCPIRKMNKSKNSYLKPWLRDSQVKYASIQNIGCFAGTKLGWFHLNITIDTKILQLQC